MGVATLLTIRNEVVLGLGSRTEIPDSDYNRYINQAYHHVSRPSVMPHYEIRQSQTIVLVTAQQAYALPTDWRGTRSVFNQTQEYRLDPEDVEDQDSRRVTNTSRPSQYVIEGVNLVLSQAPDAGANGDVLVHRYWQRPPLLTADGDTTVLNEDWDEVIQQGAIYRGWRRLNQHERMVEAREDYARLIREVQDEEFLTRRIRGWKAGPRYSPYVQAR